MEHELSAHDPSIAHGAGLAVIMPAWMRYVWRSNPERFLTLGARVFDIEPVDVVEDCIDATPEEAVEDAVLATIDELQAFFCSLGMPRTLGELGVTASRRCSRRSSSTRAPSSASSSVSRWTTPARSTRARCSDGRGCHGRGRGHRTLGHRRARAPCPHLLRHGAGRGLPLDHPDARTGRGRGRLGAQRGRRHGELRAPGHGPRRLPRSPTRAAATSSCVAWAWASRLPRASACRSWAPPPTRTSRSACRHGGGTAPSPTVRHKKGPSRTTRDGPSS